MLSPKILFGIIIAITLGGLALLAFQWWITGGIVTAVGLGFLYVWWRMNQLLQISEALGKSDMPLAKQRLDGVKNPEKLNAYSKTYYHFFKGIIETHGNNLKEARQAFKTSLEVNRFRSGDEKATAHLMLAQLDIRSRNREGAKRHLQLARGLNPGPQVMEQIKMLVKQGNIRL